MLKLEIIENYCSSYVGILQMVPILMPEGYTFELGNFKSLQQVHRKIYYEY